MPFIVETPATHRGIKQYVTKGEPPSRASRLAGMKDEAIQFPTCLDADIARKRFSSLYGLVIIEINPTGNPEGDSKS